MIIADEWLVLMKLAGEPIEYESNKVSDWFRSMDMDFRMIAHARCEEIWGRYSWPHVDRANYRWAWACGLEHASRCCNKT